jgi:hypothetical protein
MVSVLTSSVVDRGFEARSGQPKDYNIGMCCFSAKHTAWRRNSKDSTSWREQAIFQWDDDEVRFVLDQHAEVDIYSASWLKHSSAGRHFAPLWHIILISSKPVFAISPFQSWNKFPEINKAIILHYYKIIWFLISSFVWLKTNILIYIIQPSRTSYFSMRWWWGPLCSWPTRWGGYL